MKVKIFLSFLLTGLFLLVTGCEGKNGGFPNEIVIDREGGEKLMQKLGLTGISIVEQDGTLGCMVSFINYGDSMHNEPFTSSYKWISVDGYPGQEYWTFKIEPNNTGKTRILYFDSMSGNFRVDIKIKQRG